MKNIANVTFEQIADFGFSHGLTNDSYITSGRMIPVKWMALIIK